MPRRDRRGRAHGAARATVAATQSALASSAKAVCEPGSLQLGSKPRGRIGFISPRLARSQSTALAHELAWTQAFLAHQPVASMRRLYRVQRVR